MSDQQQKVHTFNRKIDERVRLAIKQPLPQQGMRSKGIPSSVHRPNPNATFTYLDAAQSKLTRPVEWSKNLFDTSVGLQNAVESGQSHFERVSEDSALSVREAEEVLTSLSDVAIAKRILVNAILSPNDMLSKELTYSCATKIFGDTTPLLLDVIKDHFDNSYKIKDKLGDMLEKALFLEGSYISVVLPESAVDEAINSSLVVSNESQTRYHKQMTESLGILGSVESQVSTGVEGETRSVTSLLGISVSDNVEYFKLPTFRKKTLSDAVASKVGPKLRNNPQTRMGSGLYQATDLLSDLYPKRKDNYLNLLTIKTLDDIDRPTVGHPIVVNVPVEAFIPVYVPGQPSSHVGGFILLDSSGNPVVKRGGTDQYRNLNARYQASYSDIASGLIQASFDKGFTNDLPSSRSGVVDEKYATQLYSLLLEEELSNRLKTGGFGEDISLGMLNRVSRIMLSRACQHLETRVIFVPRQLYSFLAFDYKDNGLGRSLLERNKTISSLRMVQEMADALANIRNAIDHKELTINIDPDDPNPWKTATEVLHNVQRSTRLGSPVGLINMASIADSFQEHGWNVKIAGHDAMPDMSVDFNQTTRNYSRPDSDYAERLRNQMFLSMGLSPDSISGVFGTEFATSVVSANVFLAQDALEKQSVFASFLSDFVVKYTTNSSILMDDLIKIIDDNKSKIRIKNLNKVDTRLIAQVFVNNVQVALPKPDLAKFELQSQALDAYESILDKMIPYYISEESMTDENFGEYTAAVVGEVQQAIKDAAMRNFAAQMNIVPELSKMLYQQPDEIQDLSMLHVQDDHFAAMLPKLQDFMARSYKRKIKADQTNEKIKELIEEKYQNQESEDADDYESDDSMDYDDDDTEGSEDSGDGDDFEDEGVFDDDFADPGEQGEDMDDAIDDMEAMLDDI